jgi:tRNA dimethylallyltransferase
MNRLVAIVGPTAIGKSRLALRLARTFGGEIVNADSRQVYRYMETGTAKPTPEELALVPHHLINITNPDESFSLAQYQELAYRAINDIHQRRKLPLLEGGSGLYVWTVVEGWQIPRVPPRPELRKKLEAKAAAIGAEKLYQELVAIDPAAAQKINPRNVRRVIRALEVYEQTSTPFSRLQRKQAPPFASLIIGLTCDRAELYRRIDERVDRMMAQGLVREVEKLVKMGYDFTLSAMSTIGYKQIGMHLRGELSLEEAVQQVKYETHRFVRHQYAWFRLKDDRIKWFNILYPFEAEVESLVADFLQSDSTEAG